jgi:DNA polymerase III epsilon subunit-like protein
MQDFNIALYNCEYIIAHNILFDFHVLANHLYRHNLYLMLDSLLSKKKFCTSIESTNILKIPLRYKTTMYKFPSLKEVYQYYFNKEFENHHDALSDAVACSQVFIKIIQDLS